MSNPLLAEALVDVVGRQDGEINLDYADSPPTTRVAATVVTESLALSGRHLDRDSAPVRNARRDAGNFVGARPDDAVLFGRNATEAINVLAESVKGDAIVLDVEHHSNLLPWLGRGARILPAGRSIDELLALLAYELRSRSAAIVAVTGASHVTGERLPLRSIASLVHRHGARLAVDGVQLVPHRAVDIARDDIDYLVYSARTLSAGSNIGVLVGRSDWLDTARPRSLGAAAARQVGLDRVDWAVGAIRHEAGSLDVGGILALQATIAQLGELGLDRIGRHGQALRDTLVRGLGSLDGVSLLRLFDDSADPVPIVGFSLAGIDSRLAARSLASGSLGTGALGTGAAFDVGDGLDTAHLLRGRLGDHSIRVSIGLGSTTSDIDRLLEALADLA